MAKKLSMLERIKQAKVRRGGQQKTWFDRIEDATVKSELLEVRRAFQAGELKHSIAQLFDECDATFPLGVQRPQFSRWINEKTDG